MGDGQLHESHRDGDEQEDFASLMTTLDRQKEQLRRSLQRELWESQSAVRLQERREALLGHRGSEFEPLKPSGFHGSAKYSFGKPRHTARMGSRHRSASASGEWDRGPRGQGSPGAGEGLPGGGARGSGAAAGASAGAGAGAGAASGTGAGRAGGRPGALGGLGGLSRPRSEVQLDLQGPGRMLGTEEANALHRRGPSWSLGPKWHAARAGQPPPGGAGHSAPGDACQQLARELGQTQASNPSWTFGKADARGLGGVESGAPGPGYYRHPTCLVTQF